MSTESAELLGMTPSDDPTQGWSKRMRRETIRAAQYHLEQMATLIATATNTPLLGFAALSEMSEHILALEAIILNEIDPGTPEAARKQLQQEVREKLGSPLAGAEWSDEAKRITELPTICDPDVEGLV